MIEIQETDLEEIQTAVQKWKKGLELDDRDIWLLGSLE